MHGQRYHKYYLQSTLSHSRYRISNLLLRLAIISLGMLKLNSRWHCLIIFISFVLKKVSRTSDWSQNPTNFWRT